MIDAQSKKKKVVTISLVCTLLVILIFFILSSRTVSIDSCLDLGGAWDYENNICSRDCIKKGYIWNDSEKLCELPS